MRFKMITMVKVKGRINYNSARSKSKVELIRLRPFVVPGQYIQILYKNSDGSRPFEIGDHTGKYKIIRNYTKNMKKIENALVDLRRF